VVANTLRLLQLAAPVKELVSRGELSAGHGRTLLGLSDPRGQLALATQAVQQGLTVRELERLVERWRTGARGRTVKKQGRAATPDVAALEEELRRSLGTRVHVRPGRKVSHLDIEFYGPDELERILERLGLRSRGQEVGGR
jgi:ParB family chromosome partitioning protein